MSGIYGMVRHDGAPVAAEALAPMAAAMLFWGHDGHGQWRGESAGLGHFMLHVTPESLHERLPASIRVAPHLVITADARIDNRAELFDALGAPGPGRDRTPDSSLILLAYERWGPDCVKRLLGDFAFAIWDSRERNLFCARDPFGCKPFVYSHDGARFIFASNVKGVLALLESPHLNEPLLAAHLQMNTCHAQKKLTFFREIVKLEAAHTLTVTAAGSVEISRCWSPEHAPEIRLASEDEYAEQVGFLFWQSVECRVRAAFSIGSHLSGGLDSSAISIAASRVLRERGDTRELAVFSWSPPPDPASTQAENEYARIDAVCQQEGLRCEYLPVTAASLIETFERDFTVEPMAMMPRERNVQLRARARRLRVMLSGWGGDEAVTCRAMTCPTEFLLRGQWSEFRKAFAARRRAGKNAAGILRDMAAVRLPDSLYDLVVADPFLKHRAPCPQPAFARRYRRELEELRGPTLRRLPGARASILRLLELGHVSLRMEDWAASGASQGLVYRYPLLDKRLVEFVLGIPPSSSLRTDQRRALFFQAVGNLLPPAADWGAIKSEPATMAALTKEHIQAHSQWADHLASRMAVSPATRFVDPTRIRKAVLASVRSGKLDTISGVRQAFGCYSIKLNP